MPHPTYVVGSEARRPGTAAIARKRSLTMPKLAFIQFLLFVLSGVSAWAQAPSLDLLTPETSNWNVLEEGKSYAFSFRLRGDSTRSAQRFSILDGRQEGMQIDSLGTFTWTPNYDLIDRVQGSKLFQVVLEGRTADGRRATQSVDFRVVHVNRAPVVNELKPIYVQYNNQNTVKLDAASVYDLDKDPLVFVPIIDQMPEGAKLSAQGEFSWKPSLTQFNKLKTTPVWIEFYVEDQPVKARTKGRFKVDVTQQDLPPMLSMVPVVERARLREDATFNLVFYLSDPNGDDDIDAMGFVSDNPDVPKAALKRNTNTQYEFTWQPGYWFVKDPLDSLVVNLTFFALDKTQKRDERRVRLTVVNTVNEREKDLQLYAQYRSGLVRAWELITQLSEREQELKRVYNRAKKGKKNRSIINAGMGATTGLAPVTIKNPATSKTLSTIGGTTVLTVGTLEATEVIGKSIKDLIDRLNYIIQKKNELQTKGDIFARKYNLKSSRRRPEFNRDLDDYISTMNVSGLVALELDAGWREKHKATDDRLEKTFKDFSRFED
jgi:hypothetical protein